VAPRPIGIKDVAAEADVSIAAVSQALRGTGRLSAATRERIRDTAERLGYRPHVGARALADGRSHVIAVSLPEIVEVPVLAGVVHHFLGILGGAAGAALAHDHLLVVAPGGAESPAWSRLTFDGAIVADPQEDEPVLAVVRRRQVPIVTVGRDPRGAAELLSVDNDVPGATRDALEHLVAGGARRVGLAVARPLMSVELDTIDTYDRWCAARSVAPRLTIVDGPQDDLAAQAARSILDADDPPDAVYATFDVIAAAVQREAARRGLAVPDDLQVMTLSDSELTRRLGITTIDERPSELGAAAVELLVDHLSPRGTNDRRRLVATDLLVRASTRDGG
jgi:LacI family transcriptional regulator